MTRVILISGKGGVGKTTVSAATALGAAQRGHKSLVVSLDRAHNLGSVLDTRLSSEVLQVPGVERLFALESDPQAELSRQWDVLQSYFSRLLTWAGIGGSVAEEVVILPGVEELLILSRLVELIEEERFDLIVVDLAPTASSLRLLSFPELMSGPLGRAMQWERRMLKLARPMLSKLFSAPLPSEEVYEAINGFIERLTLLRQMLIDPARTTVRLVGIPERVVLEESQDALTYFSLFGLCVDAMVLNRVLPPALRRGYLSGWTRIQEREIERARESFGGLALLSLRFQPDEVIGVAALSQAAKELYGEHDPAAPFSEKPLLRFEEESGAMSVSLYLPRAEDLPLDLRQRGRELILSVGRWRRQLTLPASLEHRAIQGARIHEDWLTILFSPKEAIK